ncbi:Protein of unknown function [Bacillus wiedmannii]|jgi:hypothetical protein
MALI